MVVDSRHRGLGLGKRLLLFVHQCAKELGVGSLILTSAPHRVEANGLYRSLGYDNATPTPTVSNSEADVCHRSRRLFARTHESGASLSPPALSSHAHSLASSTHGKRSASGKIANAPLSHAPPTIPSWKSALIPVILHWPWPPVCPRQSHCHLRNQRRTGRFTRPWLENSPWRTKVDIHMVIGDILQARSKCPTASIWPL